jgi:hypothetical protein
LRPSVALFCARAWLRLAPIARPHNRSRLPLGLFCAGAWLRLAPELGFVWRWSSRRTIAPDYHWVCFAPGLGLVWCPSVASFNARRWPAQPVQITVGFVSSSGVASVDAGGPARGRVGPGAVAITPK